MKNSYIDLKNRTTKENWVCGIDPSVAEHAISMVEINPGNVDFVSGCVNINKNVQTAKERREYRAARRNLDHRKARLKTFADISKCITGTSYSESKKALQNFILPQNYPTINHMIQDMLHSDIKFKISEYLSALYYLNKHRGYMHGFQPDVYKNSLKQAIENLNKYYKFLGKDIKIDSSVLEEVKEIGFYKTGKKFLNDKKEQQKRLKSITDSMSVDFYSIILSKNIPKKNNFFIESLDTSVSLFSLTDENINDFKIKYCFENFEILNHILDVYNSFSLVTVLGEEKYVCDYKVEKYNVFKERVNTLKSLYRQYATKEAYQKMFKNKNADHNFNAFISNSTTCTAFKYDKFITLLKNDLKSLKSIDEDLFNTVTQPLYLIKPSSADIGVNFSHAVRKQEFLAILDKLCFYYPQIKNIFYDKYPEYSVIEAFVKNYDFKVDYFVGPLNSDNANAWIKFKNVPCKVDPFNYEKVIDFSATIKCWMNNLIGNCSVLSNKKVLPKYSISYAKFIVLNQLNCIKVDGEYLPIKEKQSIFNNMFLNSSKNVTVKAIHNYLVKEFNFSNDVVITGIVNNIENPFIKINKVIDVIKEKNYSDQLIDEIMYVLTAMQDISSKKLELSTFNSLSEEEINELAQFSFNGWGKLSSEFLLNTYNTETKMNVLDTMFYDGVNLETIKSQNGFKKAIKEKTLNKTCVDKLNIVDCVTEYCKKKNFSPAVTSGVIYIIKSFSELVKEQNNCFPKYVCIESARVGGVEGLDTVSRKNNLLKIYKENKIDKSEPSLFEELTQVDNSLLRITKNYLFFLQLGYDVYTGEKIAQSFENFLNIDSSLYNKDHVIPQWLKIDNSIENNLVLVNSIDNQITKGELYPLPKQLKTQKTISLWKRLLNIGLMTQEKYFRLIRNTELNNAEINTFLDGELTATSQVAVAIKDIFEQYQIAKVLFISPVYATKFRQDYSFPKCREINHLHHFEDATLTAVLGYCYNISNYYYFYNNHIIGSLKNRKWNNSKIFEREIFDNKGNMIFNPKITPNQIIEIAKSPISVQRKSSVKSDLFPATISKKGAISSKDDSYTVCPASHKGKIGKSGVYKKLNTAGLLELDVIKNGKKYREYFPIKTIYYEKFLKNKHIFDLRLNELYPEGFSIVRFCPPNSIIFLDKNKEIPVIYTGTSNNSIIFSPVYEPMRDKDFSENSFKIINAVSKIRNKFPYKDGYDFNKASKALFEKVVSYNNLIVTDEALIALYDEFSDLFNNTYYKTVNPSITYYKFNKDHSISKSFVRMSKIFTKQERKLFISLSTEEKIIYVGANLLKSLKSAFGSCKISFEI